MTIITGSYKSTATHLENIIYRILWKKNYSC